MKQNSHLLFLCIFLNFYRVLFNKKESKFVERAKITLQIIYKLFTILSVSVKKMQALYN